MKRETIKGQELFNGLARFMVELVRCGKDTDAICHRAKVISNNSSDLEI